MQSVPCSLYSQGGVQLPKMGVNFTEKGGAATASLLTPSITVIPRNIEMHLLIEPRTM